MDKRSIFGILFLFLGLSLSLGGYIIPTPTIAVTKQTNYAQSYVGSSYWLYENYAVDGENGLGSYTSTIMQPLQLYGFASSDTWVRDAVVKFRVKGNIAQPLDKFQICVEWNGKSTLKMCKGLSTSWSWHYINLQSDISEPSGASIYIWDVTNLKDLKVYIKYTFISGGSGYNSKQREDLSAIQRSENQLSIDCVKVEYYPLTQKMFYSLTSAKFSRFRNNLETLYPGSQPGLSTTDLTNLDLGKIDITSYTSGYGLIFAKRDQCVVFRNASNSNGDVTFSPDSNGEYWLYVDVTFNYNVEGEVNVGYGEGQVMSECCFSAYADNVELDAQYQSGSSGWARHIYEVEESGTPKDIMGRAHYILIGDGVVLTNVQSVIFTLDCFVNSLISFNSAGYVTNRIRYSNVDISWRVFA